MKQTSPSLDEIVRDLVARAGSPVSGATDAELLGDVVAWERLGRVVDSMRVTLAGELAHRSRPELGDAGLSRAENFPTPAKLVAAVCGVSVRASRGRLGLGARLRAPEMLGGSSGRVPFPVVAVALRQGRLGVEAAAAITRELAELRARGVAADEIAAAELTLASAACSHWGAARGGGHGAVDASGRDAVDGDDPTDDVFGVADSSGRGATAAGFSVEEVTRLTVRVRDLLDPDGLEPRAQRQEKLRGLTLTRSSDGMFRGRLALTPEQGAVWLTATQAMLIPRVVPRFTSERDFVDDTLTADHRTGPQRLADAATELIARAARQPEMPRLNGAAPTLNVHVALADLESGRGAAWVDGLDDPLPLSVVDRLRCHADLITTVFGSTGQVLHHGKTRRLFSHAQNRASPRETAAASGRAATGHPPGQRPTTCGPGAIRNTRPAAPTSTTACRCGPDVPTSDSVVFCGSAYQGACLVRFLIS
jgi:hypothetical protein